MKEKLGSVRGLETWSVLCNVHGISGGSDFIEFVWRNRRHVFIEELTWELNPLTGAIMAEEWLARQVWCHSNSFPVAAEICRLWWGAQCCWIPAMGQNPETVANTPKSAWNRQLSRVGVHPQKGTSLVLTQSHFSFRSIAVDLNDVPGQGCPGSSGSLEAQGARSLWSDYQATVIYIYIFTL